MAVIDAPPRSPVTRSLTARLRGSFAVQVAALMLVCIIGAQWVSIYLFADERARSLRIASKEMAAQELVLRIESGAGDRAGLTVWTGPRPASAADVPGLPEDRPASRFRTWLAGADAALVWAPVGSGVEGAPLGFDWAVLTYETPGGRVNALLRHPEWTNPWKVRSLAAVILTSLGLILATLLVSRRVTAPMRALAEAAERFRGGRVTPVTETGPDEVARTLAAFNAMQERVTGLVAERTRMLSALGHDLRTPMTRLRLRAHLIEEDEVREPVLRDLGEMERLAERALDLARGISATGPGEAIDLSSFARELVEDLREAEIDVTLGAVEGAVLTGHADALRRAVTNLAENAHRYAGGGELSVERADDGVRLVVRDRGPGLPEDRIADVMRPFVRLEGSRAATTGGAGLGLSLAAAVAREHGRRLDLRNRDGGGLEAALVLPRG